MIIVDSRERKWDHVRTYFDTHGIPYEIHKLDYGDYMVPGTAISVDRKQNLEELARNLCTNDSRRFWNELRNAKRCGIRIVILCEHGGQIRKAIDVLGWHSSYSKITGQQIYRQMFRAAAAYNIEFRFCDKRSTGRKITEILKEVGNGGKKEEQRLGHRGPKDSPERDLDKP